MDRRRKWKHAARTAILAWAGTFLVLQAGLAVSLDTWLEEWRDPNYTARRERLRHEVERHPGQPVVVIVGSSRTMNGLCPACLPDDDQRPILLNFDADPACAGPGPARRTVAARRSTAGRSRDRGCAGACFRSPGTSRARSRCWPIAGTISRRPGGSIPWTTLPASGATRGCSRCTRIAATSSIGT